jgi:hypothetical protein
MKNTNYITLFLFAICLITLGEFQTTDSNFISTFRRIRDAVDLSQVSDEEKKEILEKRIIGKEVKLEGWEIAWAETQDAAQYPRENYLIWLKNVAAITTIVQRPQRIFYPGIGPGTSGIDILSPFFAFPNAEEIFAMDIKKDINGFGLFIREIKYDLKELIKLGVVSNLEFEENGMLTYTVKFKFLDKQRKVKIYFGQDANYFFPPELEDGYDAIYTRWTFRVGSISDKWLNPLRDNSAEGIRKKWQRFLRADSGFIIVDSKDEKGRPFFDEIDNPFWDNFFEIDFRQRGKEIDTAVIANHRVAHLLVVKNH